MARNWKLNELALELEKNEASDIMDIGRRFPLLVVVLAKLMAKAPEETKELLGAMPEYITANKIHGMLKKDAIESEDTEEVTEEEVVEVPVKKEKVAKVEKAKAEKPAAKPAKAAKKVEVAEEDDEADEEKSYEEMTAIELYKLAKARGLKPEAKKDEKFYIKLLKKDDAKVEKVVEESDDDEDWDI